MTNNSIGNCVESTTLENKSKSQKLTKLCWYVTRTFRFNYLYYLLVIFLFNIEIDSPSILTLNFDLGNF